MSEKIQKLLAGEGGNYLLPFFWQHGEDDETLRHYVHVIHDANIGAFCVESRPHPDFVGPGWWSDMDIILGEAKKLGMKVWILDDSHFPTGFANGAVDKYDESFCRQSITHRAIPVKAGETLQLTADELQAVPKPQLNDFQKMVSEKNPRVFDDDKVLDVYFVPDDVKDLAVVIKNSTVTDPNAASSGQQQAAGDFLPGASAQESASDGADKIGIRSLKEYVQEDGSLQFTPEENGRVIVLYLSRNLGFHTHYINMTHAASVRILIDTVYEAHWQHYKDEFGKTIAGFFSDEPELGNGIIYELTNYVGNPECDFPWSTEIEENLKARLGDDYTKFLYLIWEDGGSDAAARIRYAYMDVLTEMVKKNFSYQIGDWCRAHGVDYIGHMVEDNDQHETTGATLGHYFRGLAGESWAGIDDIGNQVYPQGENDNYNDNAFHRRNGEFYHFMLGKLGSSAAGIEPLKQGNSMCEIFGAYGWGEGVRLEKYLVDHFMVRGINHFVPHAFSPKAFPDSDCPPHFYAHGHNPQYRAFGYLMAYTNRVLELINGGRHISPVAVLYTAESNWADHDHVMEAHAVSRPLTEAQIDFDFVPQDVFANPEEFHTQIGAGLPEGGLHVNTQAYQSVVVPEMKYIRVDFAKAVPKMAAAGVRVLFVNAYPQVLLDSVPGDDDAAILDAARENAEVVTLDKVAAVLSGSTISSSAASGRVDASGSADSVREILFTPANSYIRYLHYEETDGSAIYMFVNEGTTTYKGTCHWVRKEGRSAYWYDAWDNVCHKAEFDGTALQLSLEPLQSYILVLEKSRTDEGEGTDLGSFVPTWEEKRAGTSEINFDGAWKRSLVSNPDYPDFGEAKEVSLPDHLDEEEPLWSGIARYENTFTLARTEGADGAKAASVAPGAVGSRHYLLEISDAAEAVEVFINGSSLGYQVVPTFRFDLSNYVKEGVNDLRIEVATTLERETSTIPNPFAKLIGADPTPHNPSGLNGVVKLYS